MANKGKSKFYVVWNGVDPGIYDNWKDCEAQVKGYPDARYQAFATREAAEEAFHGGYTARAKQRPVSRAKTDPHSKDINLKSIAVDAACSGNPGVMEYRGVVTSTGEQLFYQGPFKHGTNNIGEFLALVHGLAYLKGLGDNETAIYSDSRIAQNWVKAGKARTKLERSGKTAALYKLIERAENWLAGNKWKNPILKWETELWGEIPADFGRK